ncbi:MAG: hypothetical protein NVS2B16_17050 [Chloroflexota bacterium]
MELLDDRITRAAALPLAAPLGEAKNEAVPPPPVCDVAFGVGMGELTTGAGVFVGGVVGPDGVVAVAAGLVGLGVGVGTCGGVVAVGAAVGGTVAVAGIDVAVAGTVGDGGGGGGVIGVGINVGGGGGVLAAPNAFDAGRWVAEPIASRPTVKGTAIPRVMRLFIQDSLRV